MRQSVFSVAAAALVAVATTGCEEPPSYRLRWAVGGKTLTSASDCSDVGILNVRVTTIDLLGRPVARETFPCFGEDFEDPTATAPGAAIEPGPYAIEVRGISRNDTVWTDEEELERQIFDAEVDGNDYLADQRYQLCRPVPPPDFPIADKVADVFSCQAEDLSCDCAELTVPEEGLPILDSFNIDAPPECLDGLDNDNDGLVDRKDAACVGGRIDLPESAEFSQVNFRVGVTFFRGNPSAECNATAQTVGFSRAVLDIDDEEYASVSCGGLPFEFAPALEGGEHSLTVSLRDQDGNDVATPQSFTVDVDPIVGGAFELTADFAAEDFVEPIETAAQYGVQFVGHPDQEQRGCTPLRAEQGSLALPTLRARVLDGRGDAIPTVTQDGNVPLDGMTEFECPTGSYFTESLVWGDYIIEVEALSAEDEVCYSSIGSGTPLAPGSSATAIPARVVPVPDSCRDCATDDDCGAFICEEGICIEPCETAVQCNVDLGETCSEDGRCIPAE